MSDFWYWDKSRVISLVIAGIYLILAIFFGAEDLWLKSLGFLLFGLVCIWFGDELGDYEGMIRFIPVRKTPGAFIRFAGWVLLLFPIIVVIISYFNK